MGVNTRNSIVTNGLTHYIDVLSPVSYTSGSTTWRNLGSDTGSMTLSSTNTYSGISLYPTASGIVQVYWPTNYNGFVSQAGSYSLWVKLSNGSATSQTLIFYSGGSGNNLIYFYRNSNTSPTNRYQWVMYYTGSAGANFYLPSYNFPINTWCNTTLTHTSDGTGSMYVNGTLVNQQAMSNFTQWTRNAGNTPQISMFVTSSAAGTSYGEFGMFQRYDRALSAQEIAQNYNATKTRFNLT